jgi:hypothetical protein
MWHSSYTTNRVLDVLLTVGTGVVIILAVILTAVVIAGPAAIMSFLNTL